MADLRPAPVAFGDAVKLWDAAMDLPIAAPSDFMSPANYDDGVKQLVRVIEDADLRSRLIQAGLAEPVERPKRGRPPRRTVIRLRPSADARRNPVEHRMSVEQGRRLVTAIYEAEAGLRREFAADRDTRLRELKAAITVAAEDELPPLLARMRAVVDETTATHAQIRLLAFHRIAKTASPDYRVLLTLVAPDVDEADLPIVDEAPRPMDPRRKAYRDEWDRRLLGALTAEFEASREIARRLKAANETVLERLNDMYRRGLVEKTLRRIATPQPKPTKNKKRKHVRVTAAFFRLST